MGGLISKDLIEFGKGLVESKKIKDMYKNEVKENIDLKEKDIINILKKDDLFIDNNVKFKGYLSEYKNNKYVSELIENKNIFKMYCFYSGYKSSIVKDELRNLIGKDDFNYRYFLKICNDIDSNFRLSKEIYFNNIKNEYLEIILSSDNDKELSENILKFIFGKFEDYLKYLEVYEEKKISNYWDKLYYISKFLKKIIGIDFINISINIDENNVNYYLNSFFDEYEKKLKKNSERLNNRDIIEVSFECKDKIIELYDLGMSKRKIIDSISNDLWDKNIIERKVERSIRKRGVKNVKEMVDNKISKNVVDEIINEYLNNR